MFKLFRKKNAIDSYSLNLVSEEWTVKAKRQGLSINMQLALLDERHKQLHCFEDAYVRGYLFGFTNASFQYMDALIDSDELLMAIQYLAHSEIEPKLDKHYVVKSASMMDSPLFNKGQMCGGNDYFKFMNREIIAPLGLASYLRGDVII
ncbi:hypothetical protein CFBP6411_00142 [Pseudomonas syringae group genomosp. 3]|uniref:Uncharacterized protein n=1 Tax=Pseudomonas syringae group genomosp. 3 TaxID=251701 RepID=A0A2K4W6P2_9PSED|nr:hypothetical protein [Pseudomonas syringae group genomosp. 3]SOS31512.1 hypothetical protein CFBP6411_00142 [Pseudomonas syringae group genomosp. 3]